MQRISLFLLILLACVAGKPLAAAESRPQTLARVEAYLNALDTIQADFVQITPEGSLATGKFFLKRPGKMRWQYEPPTPILMVTSGNYLIYYDYELEQVNRIPLDETLAGFLARGHISFDSEVVNVLEVKKADGAVRVRLAQARRPGDGELTLELADNPLQLRNLIVKDARGQETNVSLSNAHYGVALDDGLFAFRDPTHGRRVRR